MKIRQFLYIFTALFIFSTLIDASTVLIDNGGVITYTDSTAALKELGLCNILYYTLILKKDPRQITNHIRKRFYELLELAADNNNINIPKKAIHELPRDEKGNILPRLMHLWQNGTISGKQVRILTKQTIKNNSEWFVHVVEKRLLIKMTNMVFTPETFIKTRKLSPHAVQFITQCKAHGHSVYLLSNWDAESFSLFKETYPELCSLFDGLIISGSEHSTKPEKTIYQNTLKKYNLNPDDCFFFDDQKENISAARACGINAILYTHPSTLTLSQLPEPIPNQSLA